MAWNTKALPETLTVQGKVLYRVHGFNYEEIKAICKKFKIYHRTYSFASGGMPQKRVYTEIPDLVEFANSHKFTINIIDKHMSSEVFTMEFKDTLKMLRKQQNLTHSELAKLTKTSSTIISLWESGQRKPSFDCLIKLADFFVVSADDLLGRNHVKGSTFVQSPEEFRELMPYSKPELSFGKRNTKDFLEGLNIISKFLPEKDLITRVSNNRIESINIQELIDVSFPVKCVKTLYQLGWEISCVKDHLYYSFYFLDIPPQFKPCDAEREYGFKIK